MKKTVVILLSDKRSGSTMFERELCKHPDISHVDYTPHSYNETHHWTMAACMLGEASRAAHNCLSYGNRESARQYMIDGLLGNMPDYTVPESDEELVFAGWEALCEKFCHPVFFEKSPQLIHRWDALELLLQWADKTSFDVKYIGLVRNPMAVMYSAQKLFGTDPVDRQHGWAESCHHLASFEKKVGSENILRIKYEDMIQQPVKGFAEVCEFIGVKSDEAIGKDVHARSLNAWKKARDFTLQLDAAVTEVAKGEAYSDEELANPGKKQPTEWQKRWNRWGTSMRVFKSRLLNWYVRPIYLRFFKKR